MAQKNIILTNGNITETTYNDEKIDALTPPIYYHSILMDGVLTTDNTLVCRITGMFINNDATAYNLTTGIAKFKELMDAGKLININGYIQYSSDGTAYVCVMYKQGSNYIINGGRESGSVSFNFDTELTIQNFVDGVTKIN